MSSFLLDTNILSESMRRKPNLTVDAWVFQQEIINLSLISVEEFYFGLLAKDAHQKLAWFEELIYESKRTKILPITLEIVKHAGLLRARFKQRGLIRSQADMLIAATAHQHGLTLATRNTKDFDGCGIPLFNPFEA